MKLYVMRHGLTTLNKQKRLNAQIDEPLSQEGIEQAKKAATLLSTSIQHIYASSLLRAKQTAELANEILKRPITLVDELQEVNMGTAAGKTWEQISNNPKAQELHRKLAYDYSKIGGETADQVQERVKRFLQNLYGKHKDHEALLVTHGGIFRILHFLQYGQHLINEVEHATPIEFDLKKILKIK